MSQKRRSDTSETSSRKRQSSQVDTDQTQQAPTKKKLKFTDNTTTQHYTTQHASGSGKCYRGFTNQESAPYCPNFYCSKDRATKRVRQQRIIRSCKGRAEPRLRIRRRAAGMGT